MNKTSQKLRLLVVSFLPNDAEEMGSHLRNAGYGARTRWCSSYEKALEILEEYHANLVLCGDELPDSEFTHCLQAISSQRPGVPLLALGDSSDPSATTKAMGLGAYDRVVRDDPEHMQLAISREYNSFCRSRDLDICQARMTLVESRHDTLLNESTEPVAYVQEGILTRGNPAYAELMGLENAEALKDLPIMDLTGEDDREELKKLLKACANGQAPEAPVTLTAQRLDGETIPVDFYFSEIRVGDEEQVEIIARAHGPGFGSGGASSSGGTGPATLDPSANHYAMYEALKKACGEESQDESVNSLFYLAIDDFETIQSENGFSEADQVHDALQGLLRECIAEQDQFFQFASGEFIILGQRESIDAAEKTAKDWADEIEAHDFGSNVLDLAVSIVACPLASHDIKPQTVLKRSRETVRMMADKAADKVHTLTLEDDSGKMGDQHWLKFIKQALSQDDLELNYQSIASLEGELTSYFEVTVRMIDEHRQEIKASEFMPTAEKHGLMESIDRWVIEHALKVLGRQDRGQNSQLFVKLSVDSLKSDDFMTWLTEQAKAHESRIANIIFELKTSAVQAVGKKALGRAKALKKLGAMVALEQVNAEARSQKLVQDMPMDFLKLDPTMTENLESDDSQYENINRIMENAREKKIKTIAEHVEKANSMATLWQFGVNYVQGHFVQEPEVMLTASEVNLP